LIYININKKKILNLISKFYIFFFLNNIIYNKMGGGLMQLVAYGAQDVYLTGNPQITFFKVVYRRHTNFALESIAQTFNGQADFGKTASCTISRNGDLITGMYLQATLPSLTSKVATYQADVGEGTGMVCSPCLLGVDGIESDIQSIITATANESDDITCVDASGTTVQGSLLISAAATCTPAAMKAAAGRGHARWVQNVGHAMINTVSVEIGGQRIDRHDGRWLQVWHELSGSVNKQYGHDRMVGNMVELNDPVSLLSQSAGTPFVLLEDWSDCSNALHGGTTAAAVPGGAVAQTFNMEHYTLMVPFAFWFNINPGLALPLIALQYHEVKINVEFHPITRVLRGCVNSTCCLALCDVKLWVDYIYLDTDERRRFAQVSHEYLIEQVQFTGSESVINTNARININFNHPVKELIWVAEPDVQSFVRNDDAAGVGSTTWQVGASNSTSSGTVTYTGLNDVFNFSNDPTAENKHIHCNPTQTGTLYLNGHERETTRTGDYFNLTVPWESHSRTPSCGVNVISFAIKPEEHQPSGTCNYSRIDKAVLSLSLRTFHRGHSTNASNNAYNLSVYAVNYNVLRIMSGMGGLAYSN
jgi:hypothetical protein